MVEGNKSCILKTSILWVNDGLSNDHLSVSWYQTQTLTKQNKVFSLSKKYDWMVEGNELCILKTLILWVNDGLSNDHLSVGWYQTQTLTKQKKVFSLSKKYDWMVEGNESCILKTLILWVNDGLLNDHLSVSWYQTQTLTKKKKVFQLSKKYDWIVKGNKSCILKTSILWLNDGSSSDHSSVSRYRTQTLTKQKKLFRLAKNRIEWSKEMSGVFWKLQFYE